MAGLNDSLLVQNPIEVSDLQKFILERTFEKPELMALHNVITGVTMKEQIVFASQFGMTGIKGDGTCSRKNSGAESNLTQKYWEPVGIEDSIVWCNATLNSMFKAYFSKIKNYKDLYEIQGSDLDIFFTILLGEAMDRTIRRASWFGDKAVAVADGTNPGLKVAGDVQFFDYFDGFWKQVFAGVAASDIERYTISENTGTTPAAQLTLAAGRSVEIFEGVWGKADPRLKADMSAQFEVSNAIWENYRQYLQGKGENFTIEYTVEGLRELKWNGRKVINMETVWDLDLQAKFVDNTTNNAYYNPNRIILSTPANMPIGTLNEDDFTAIDAFYDKTEKQNYFEYGFSLDAKVLEEYMIVVGY